MRTWVYLPLLLSGMVPWLVRWTATRVSPATAVRTAAAAAAAAAGTWVCCLALLALTFCDDLPPLSAFDRRPDLGLPKPVPDVVALAAAAALAVGLARLVREVVRRRRVLRELRGAGRPNGGLVVADWTEPFAVAVPGRPGRSGHLLVTSGMLRLLDAQERRVLFAHEQSHLRRRHHHWVAVAVWSAALSPLLKPLSAQVAHATERWADEDAAIQVGDRHLVARAVAKASLAGGVRRLEPAMALHGSGAVARVRALQQPCRQSRLWAVAGVVGWCALLLGATAVALAEFGDVARAWLTQLG
ncbi:M56 family metallopeptidase [Catellatospora tritici]|uniref:M56 family metallopeptidase n=1 Tax=Catellatospora tritici TaxID=2851566 RepID=UPI001C2CE46F|nr:M56 family metallopeptidase [Catellatospora tritici]MBV1853696.1 M56 family metallopeptidase [Catellatospora tritici]